MTNPVILLGTQSNGETLPVQVDATGRLVAEGLQGEQGPPGPISGSFPLPADPYEGALLGWLNGQLAWIGTPPVPVPEGVFGPISDVPDPALLVVEGEIPATVGNGVYIYQCNADGTPFTEGWDVSRTWSENYTVTTPPAGGESNLAPVGFNGSTDPADGYVYAANGGSQTITFDPAITFETRLEIWCWASTAGVFEVNGVDLQPNINNVAVDFPGGWVDLTSVISGNAINSIKISKTASSTSPGFIAVRADNQLLVDFANRLGMRVNQVDGQMILGTPLADVPFTVGKYLRTPEQRVAPWVLYGNDPTLVIDHLRQTRD